MLLPGKEACTQAARAAPLGRRCGTAKLCEAHQRRALSVYAYYTAARQHLPMCDLYGSVLFWYRPRQYDRKVGSPLKRSSLGSCDLSRQLSLISRSADDRCVLLGAGHDSSIAYLHLSL